MGLDEHLAVPLSFVLSAIAPLTAHLYLRTSFRANLACKITKHRFELVSFSHCCDSVQQSIVGSGPDSMLTCGSCGEETVSKRYEGFGRMFDHFNAPGMTIKTFVEGLVTESSDLDPLSAAVLAEGLTERLVVLKDYIRSPSTVAVAGDTRRVQKDLRKLATAPLRA